MNNKNTQQEVIFDDGDKQIINNFYSDLEKIFYNLIISKIDENGETSIMFPQNTFYEPSNYFDDFTPMFNDEFFNSFIENSAKKLFDDKLIDYIIDRLMEHTNISLAKNGSTFRILHFFPENLPDATKQMITNDLGIYKKVNSKKEYDEIQNNKGIPETYDYFEELEKKNESIKLN